MPQVKVLIIFEGNHGESGEVLAQEVRELLDSNGYHVVELEYQGARPTDDELDAIRWQSDGGAND